MPPRVHWARATMQGGEGRELQVAPRWFEVTEVGDEVFRITEPYVHARGRAHEVIADYLASRGL